jgi:hypothetical protein
MTLINGQVERHCRDAYSKHQWLRGAISLWEGMVKDWRLNTKSVKKEAGNP